MSQTAQDKSKVNSLGFTTTQAYTLAIITLVIGIAVGYFARGSASSSAAPESAQAAAPAATTTGGMGIAPAQLPGIGSSQQQQAASPEMLAKAAEPLLGQLQSNPNDVETIVKLGNLYYDSQAYPAGHSVLREGAGPSAQQR